MKNNFLVQFGLGAGPECVCTDSEALGVLHVEEVSVGGAKLFCKIA